MEQFRGMRFQVVAGNDPDFDVGDILDWDQVMALRRDRHEARPFSQQKTPEPDGPDHKN